MNLSDLPPDIKKSRLWRTDEERILREHYAEGAAVCEQYLPGRSRASIISYAHRLKLKGPHYTGNFQRRYERSEALDNQIRDLYAKSPTRADVRNFAAVVMRPRWWVCKRAAELGIALPRQKELPWSREEIAFLAEHGHKNLANVRALMAKAGFNRTATAIGIQLARRGIERTTHGEWSATQLARLLGVDPKTVMRWVATQGLPAKRAGSKRSEGQGDFYIIQRKPLRAWMATHAQLIDLRKVERYWFIDLAFNVAVE